jgi:hypothetical protein
MLYLLVFVRAYDRFRYGRWERVRAHTRRWPRLSWLFSLARAQITVSGTIISPPHANS